MRPLMIIRKAHPSDELQCQEIVKDYVMSFASDAFMFSLFREITLQLIVLVWALMFIFLGIPIIVCLWSVPIVIIVIFVSVYVSYYNKAVEVTNVRAEHTWVAEAFVPLFIRCTLRELDFEIISSGEFKPTYLSGYRPTIIGTISLTAHHSLHKSSWICKLAVGPKYSFDRVAEPLIQQVLQHAISNDRQSVEISAAECQSDLRELLLKLGFDIRQIYHKRILGNSIKIMRSQMGINLNKLMDRSDLHYC